MKKLSKREQYYEVEQEYKKKCECGHTQLVPTFEEYAICTHCNKKIFRDDSKQELAIEQRKRDDFKLKLKKLIV